MSDRRSRVTPFVGAGAAGLALAFAAAPHAVAQAPQTSASPAGPAGSDAHSAPARHVSVAPSETTSSPVEPDYGYQKFRVGVRIASGAVVPDGTSTAGSEVTITETGPGADGGSRTTTCTTVADSPEDAEPGSTATYCEFPDSFPATRARAGARALDFDNYFIARPGDTITLKQTTVRPNLLIDTVTQTIAPAVTDCGSFFCTSPTRDAVIFNDPAPGPIAADDCTTTVRVGRSALIDVEANDTPKAPITSLAVVVAPTAGTAAVENAKIRYTPDGRRSTDSFTYRITTGNGSARAKVCLTIAGVGASTTSRPSTTPVTSPVSSAASTPVSTTDSVSPTSTSVPPLADTGAPTGSLGAIGVGLIVVGGVAVAAGTRRRSRGRHA